MGLGRVAEIFDEQVRVRSERDANVAVPHEALDAVRVHAAAEQLGGERVAQIVEADRDVERDGPQAPSTGLSEPPSAAVRGLAAGRAETRLGVAGALLVPAPAAAVLVPIHDAGACQRVPQDLLRVRLALSLRAVRGGKTSGPGACSS